MFPDDPVDPGDDDADENLPVGINPRHSRMPWPEDYFGVQPFARVNVGEPARVITERRAQQAE